MENGLEIGVIPGLYGLLNHLLPLYYSPNHTLIRVVSDSLQPVKGERE